ncbi:PREDICTED: pleckstrin homology domain-containing family N member 1 isoform X2 [Galeopterus variegatus]|uniref:Pleckstrin homology domain-containing family N member 1 isoform X2 n=1 Tax=Galeopterus variegatus TaxID=482537 RepID=A0ABM0QHR4_GALVR|nr:PREDICTED: pleckstrin homology domain-containing family N member 1 isoform X2 [Galeopterus variegatus]
MGNSHCVPQAPRRLRASFSRKPSLKGNREDSARKLAGPDRDTAADKIFHYIPGTDIPSLDSQRENLEQPILSVFKKGRRRVPVRNLGKVVHYAKVQLRFQHSQDISDCYLELFHSHLYFQAHGSEGLTFQGLLPLTEVSICPLEGSREHGFQITGPLPAPLLVLCPSEAELGCWLYHLEKQMALMRGLQHCQSAPPQGPPGDELPWTLQRRLTRLRTASGRESVGSAICASRVKLQHLPSQEQWDRLLVLYPTSLAIFSEEPDRLCFKGELPLSAIHINLEEKEKQIRSFLIEGRLINTIRVLCASYEDYSHWLLCLRTVSCRDGGPLLPSPESFPGLQVVGGGRGSLSSDGRTSWDSGCPAPASTRTSHSRPESLVLSNSSCPAQPAPVIRLSLAGSPEATDPAPETPHSPLYADPYTPPATSHRRITDVGGLDEFLSAMRSSPAPVLSSPFPSVPVSVPVTDPGSGLASCPGLLGPHLLSKKGALQSRASQRHRGSIKGRGPWPPDSPQLVSPARKGSPEPPLPPPDDGSPKKREGPGYDNIWDKASSPSLQKWPRLGGPEAEGGLIQWI